VGSGCGPGPPGDSDWFFENASAIDMYLTRSAGGAAKVDKDDADASAIRFNAGV